MLDAPPGPSSSASSNSSFIFLCQPTHRSVLANTLCLIYWLVGIYLIFFCPWQMPGVDCLYLDISLSPLVFSPPYLYNPACALQLAFCIHLLVDVLELTQNSSNPCSILSLLRPCYPVPLLSQIKWLWSHLCLSVSLHLFCYHILCFWGQYLFGCSLPHSHHQSLDPGLHHFMSGYLQWLLLALPTTLSLF